MSKNICIYTDEGGWKEEVKCENCKKHLTDYKQSEYTNWHGETTTTRQWKCPDCNHITEINFYW